MGSARQLFDAHHIAMTSEAGFSELYERNYEAVYRTALRITGNPADAEDVLQTVFVRLLNPGTRSDILRMPEAYFRRAAANAALDILRRKALHAESELDEATSRAADESVALLKERLRRALATLQPSDAEVFLLRYVEGLSNGELAEMFGLGKNNVAVRLHRIRQALQVEMER